MQGLRVVNVVGFKRGFGYLDEILALAKPFGTVVRHLVLDVRPEVTALKHISCYVVKRRNSMHTHTL